MIKELLSKGKTKVVKGFKSQRTGKEFSAALRLGENNKVVFDFNNPKKGDTSTGTTPKQERNKAKVPFPKVISQLG